MTSDKLTYPELIIIDGTEYNGKRNRSKGQILIPYTAAPNVGIGDVIIRKADKKDVFLKVTGTSFIEDGSFGIGTDHPHLLALKVANTSAQPRPSKKQTSTVKVSSAPGEQMPASQKRSKIKTISMQHFMKHVAKNLGKESTATEKPPAQNAAADSVSGPVPPTSSIAREKTVPPIEKADATRSDMEVRLLQSENELKTVAPLLMLIRPHFDLNALITRIKILQKRGYKLVYVVSGVKVFCVAGFVTGYKLDWGKHIYIDDLVFDEKQPSGGAGNILIEWFKTYARENGYKEIHLDSSVLRFHLHRFYLESGFHIDSHHFSLKRID